MSGPGDLFIFILDSLEAVSNSRKTIGGMQFGGITADNGLKVILDSTV